MGTLNNPGAYDCLKKLQANPDMPYFLLLASDKRAPKRVRDWAAEVLADPTATPREREKAAEAYEVAGKMDAYLALQPKEQG